jgi:hypothetical protein
LKDAKSCGVNCFRQLPQSEETAVLNRNSVREDKFASPPANSRGSEESKNEAVDEERDEQFRQLGKI